ncbi:synaptopodin 2-like protein isoform X2 [Acipenser ruthenus]|uniref:synaptopodin 2-like protein isoform X2 n=1 Tax=Acipenser ruthenus TaxID=7906 RepID=UPI0027420A73|nr:synaptopodin 2-like protein isoform X2 [Acipenser ruthenus]
MPKQLPLRKQGSAHSNLVRKRSKACRAGLREGDELLSINEKMCRGLSHAQAMTLIDSAPGTLRIRIRRSPAGFQSVVLFTRSPSPRIDRDYRAALRALSPPVTKPAATGQPDRSAVMSPTGGECLIRTLDPHRDCLISPLDSEAYYGETDSDADTALVKQRRPKRRSPSATPVKPSGHTSPEETSEMSGYESAPDARPHTTLPGLTQPQDAGPGVARREILFQPRPVEEEEEAGLEEALSYPSDGQGAAEVDSGFQEPPSVPLVSPERAKDASRLLFSSSQLVPMVGPVDRPVDEELTTSYKDKARQAKLHRSESVQEKQVKEARSKCRTIASLLTAAPNPHSKGVLMFKKRRQRSKKYTLISFGSVEGDMEAREEDEEEGEGAFPTSESEFDEEGFSAAPDTDPDWDRNYLDILERKKTPAQTLQGPPQGLSGTVGKGAQLYEQQQRRRAEENFVSEAARQGEQGTQGNQGTPTAVPSMSPAQPPPSFGMMNGDVPPARHPDLVKSPPAPAPPAPPAHSVPGAFSVPAQQPANSLLDRTNRTARPFTPGFVGGRSATAPVVFRPGKKAAVPTPQQPAPAPPPLSPPPFSPPPSLSTSSLYITPRPAANTTQVPFFSPPPPAPVSPRAPLGVISPPPSTPFSPPPMPIASFSSMTLRAPLEVTSPLPSTPFSPPSMSTASFPSYLSAPAVNGAKPVPSSSTLTPASTLTPTSASLTSLPASAAPAFPAPFLSSSSEALASREQRISIPAARTGILLESRRRGTRKSLFSLPEEKPSHSPNPALLSLVQNLDEKPPKGGEAGFESGPEEDLLNLGAEACNFMQAQKHRTPPPVAPKPHLRAPEVPQMSGKGAELFARRQSRMDRFVVGGGAPGQQQQLSSSQQDQPSAPSPTPSLPAHWKYSPNIRAPPPIGYNPLLSPSCPPGAQKGSKTGANQPATWSGRKATPQKQGIRALDFMKRQPYQLNPAMFGGVGGSQQQAAPMLGSSLTPPQQIPVKAARVYEIKRFSTPTPMSAPTSHMPTVIVPRSATTLGEPLWRSDICSPPPTPWSPPPPVYSAPTPLTPSAHPIPTPLSPPSHPAPPVFQTKTPLAPAPAPAPAPLYPSFQATKQFKSAPELSPLVSSSPQGIQVPRRFQVSRIGNQANVWRPGSLHY